MDLLDALGVKAVGLRRRIPFANFVSWLFKAPRAGSRPISKIILGLACVSCIYGSRMQLAPIVFIESVLLDFITPVVALLQKPLVVFSNLNNYLTTHEELRAENELLKAQNQNVLRSNMVLSQQAFIDHQSRKQLKFAQAHLAPSAMEGALVATVLNNPPLGMPILISHTKDFDDLENAVAVGAKGVVGRLQNGGHFFAQVTTILDPTSRIPVEVAGVQAIASGQGTSLLNLTHIQEGEHRIQKGDIVYTSGFGGIFPKALPIGRVTSIENKEILIHPFESFSGLHTVILLPPVPKA